MNLTLIELVSECRKRLEDQSEINLVSSNELHALATAIEVELINRAAEYQKYPEVLW